MSSKEKGEPLPGPFPLTGISALAEICRGCDIHCPPRSSSPLEEKVESCNTMEISPSAWMISLGD